MGNSEEKRRSVVYLPLLLVMTAIPLRACRGPEGSRRSRLPDFETVGTWRWYSCQSFTPTNL